MELKEFATSRNMSQAKARKLAQEVLGEIPLNFTEEQLQKLDQILGRISENFLEQSNVFLEADTSKANKELINLSLEEATPAELAERVKGIMGSELLKRNALLYVSFLKQSLEESKYKLDVAVFQIEQGFYNHLQHYQNSLYEDGKQRINKASTETMTLFSVEGIKTEMAKNDNSDLVSLLEEALSFFEAIG